MKINFNKLQKYCLSSIKSFEKIGDVYDTKAGMYIYRDNGAKVLAVAHLDTVLNLRHFYVNHIGNDSYVFNAQLDDRLGAYVICDLLPSLGLKYDILLTEGEEVGRSTAEYFQGAKEYNWMFSFDRKGEDVVTYQYDSDKWSKVIEKSGFKMGLGSFSDIAFMDDLGVRGLNIGTGYHGEHTDLCYCKVSELKRQVNRFRDFYNRNKDTRFPYDGAEWYYRQYNGKSDKYAAWDDYGNYSSGTSSAIRKFNEGLCKMCYVNEATIPLNDNFAVCEGCFNEVDICQGCEAILYSTQLSDGLCDVCRKIEWKANNL